MSQKCIDPATVDEYVSDMIADVTATAVPVQVLPGDGNRIAVWTAIQGLVTITAGNFVQVGVMLGGKFVAVQSFGSSDGDAYMSILQYGSIVQQPIFIQSASANQIVSIGYLRRTYRSQ